MQQVRIADIEVGERYRKDLGDIAGLAASINRLGLLQPIVITKAKRLVAGTRRLEAARILDWDTIPCFVAANLNDAVKLLAAERDENTCRKEFTTMEAVAIGKALEALEQPLAKERQREAASRGGKARHGISVPENLRDAGGGDTRDKIGKAIGMSGPTFQRAKAVADAAESEPETFGHIAEEMNRTGKVMPAFEKVQAIRSGKKKTKRTSSPRFDDSVYESHIAALRAYLDARFTKAGGAEQRDQCARLINQLEEGISQWRHVKPV